MSGEKHGRGVQQSWQIREGVSDVAGLKRQRSSRPVMIAYEGPEASLSGANTSSRRSPVVGPAWTVKPKFVGGLLLVGLLVPLSMHWPAPAQYPCS